MSAVCFRTVVGIGSASLDLSGSLPCNGVHDVMGGQLFESRKRHAVPHPTIVMIIGTAQDPADLIIVVKVCIDRFYGFGLTKDQSLGLP